MSSNKEYHKQWSLRNKDKYFHVDHCHDTGRVRGILCHQCNWYMGLIDRDSETQVRLCMYGHSIHQVHPDIRAKQWPKKKD